MKILTPEQVARVFEVTDALRLHRNWVVLPLAAAEAPREIIMPDGKVLIRAPGGAAFDKWIGDLRTRLESLDLSRTPRADEHDPRPVNVPACAPPGSGSRRYLNWDPKTQG